MWTGNSIAEEGIGMAGCLIATAPFPMRDRKLICVIASVLVAETGTCRAAALTGECFGLSGRGGDGSSSTGAKGMLTAGTALRHNLTRAG